MYNQYNADAARRLKTEKNENISAFICGITVVYGLVQFGGLNCWWGGVEWSEM